jgi:hypothetical protein
VGLPAAECIRRSHEAAVRGVTPAGDSHVCVTAEHGSPLNLTGAGDTVNRFGTKR